MKPRRLGPLLLLLINLGAAALPSRADNTLYALRALPSFATEAVSPRDVKTNPDTLGFWLWSATSAPKRFSTDQPLPTSLEATIGMLEIRVGDGRAPLPDGLTLR
ncbi:MAG: hypothetical protein HC897_19945, partial [Thermoanaerobaculia bacterium]|nr:hypothetical protein [Thermoanaerobaculia bacterium]